MRVQFEALLRQNFRFGRMPQSRTLLRCGRIHAARKLGG